MCSLHFICEHKLIVVLTNSVFMIFLIVYSRIRHALRSGGYRDGFAALRLQNLLVFCPRGEVAQRAEGGIPVRS